MHYAELALQLPNDGNQILMNNLTTAQQQQQHQLQLQQQQQQQLQMQLQQTLMQKKQPPAYNYFDEPTIYAQIDHYKTVAASPFQHPQQQQQSQQSISPQTTIPLQTASAAVTPQNYQKPFLREIVTIRTPVMFTQQESCV